MNILGMVPAGKAGQVGQVAECITGLSSRLSTEFSTRHSVVQYILW
ncbi:45320_t:CDS:1, partial [Gigaspora margarita]